MESPLAEHTSRCLIIYNTIESRAGSTQYKKIDISSTAYLTDSALRFRIWAANLGSYHPISDPKSADYRLRGAPLIVKHLTEVLSELSGILEDIEAIVTGVRLDQSYIVYSHNEASNDEDLDPVSEMHELCASLPDLITSLFKVSIFIRRSTTRDRYAKAAAVAQDSFLPEFDIRHVLEKFPKTASRPLLRARLGNAITDRRQFLRYARDHRDRIAQARSHDEASTDLQAAPPHAGSVLAPTTASTLQAQRISDDISYNLEEEFNETRSQGTSFVSSHASSEGSHKLRVEKLSEMQKNGAEFVCPYCKGIVRARTDRFWRKHVFRDLRAYACTFEDCTAGLFEEKESWFRHELEQHRRLWFCPSCSSKAFLSADGLRRHLLIDHNFRETSSEAINSAVRANSRPVAEISASACPLCNEWEERLRAESAAKGINVPREHDLMVPLARFRNHVAKHQEQLALFAITPSFGEETDSESGSRKANPSEAEQDFISSAESGEPPSDVDSTTFSEDEVPSEESMPSLVYEYFEMQGNIGVYLERLQELDYQHQEGLAERNFIIDKGEIPEISDQAFESRYKEHRSQMEIDLANARDRLAELSTDCQAAGLDPETYR